MAKRKLNFSSSSAVFDRVKAFKAVKDDDLEPSLAPPAPTDASRDASLSNSAAIGDVSPSTDAASAEVASALNDEDRFFSGDGMSGHERALFEVINTVEAQEVVDEAAVKGMSSKLAKALIKNQEMRVRFPDQPEKFMDSETQLVEQIGAFTRVGEHPELYEALTTSVPRERGRRS
ncbi:hypothetical protein CAUPRSCDRAFT_11816 [Caulochytrium protostelioides]|uniref:Beta-catenin-like protein 1 N-terminal domain-containing protein n=1 Tax=Caulochytrium protostelioides TaxID=1555241 RepID=A0A4P9WT89_9FUNG|nr:hypothetical protein CAUPRSCDRAFT_11816 [Caulochytrium protostelioides]